MQIALIFAHLHIDHLKSSIEHLLTNLRLDHCRDVQPRRLRWVTNKR